MVQMLLKQSGSATLLALALSLLTRIPSATAQTADQAWAYCNNANNQFGPEVQMGGCTAVIQNAHRVARHLKRAGNLLDRPPLDEEFAVYPSARFHNQHPAQPHAQKQGA